MKAILSLERVAARELALCAWFNRGCRYPIVKTSLSVISRLGDGKLWYSLTAALPLLHGRAGLDASLHMAAAGLVGVLLYQFIKNNTQRHRPYMVNGEIRLGASPLARYSFPSRHTLHAVAFTTIAVAYFPPLGGLLIPVIALIALSRIVLGLHYPTDVGTGALIGLSLTVISLQF